MPGDDHRDDRGGSDLSLSGDGRDSDDLEAAALSRGEVSEYIETRRLQQIFKARERVQERTDRAEELYFANKLQKEAQNIVLFRSVQSYIRELAPLLREYTRETEDAYYYREAKIGTVFFESRDDLEISGLREFLIADSLYVETIQNEIDYPQGPPQIHEEDKVRYMPKRMSWRAFDLANEFCHSVNIDVPLEVGGSEAEFQYADLIE